MTHASSCPPPPKNNQKTTNVHKEKINPPSPPITSPMEKCGAEPPPPAPALWGRAWAPPPRGD